MIRSAVLTLCLAPCTPAQQTEHPDTIGAWIPAERGLRAVDAGSLVPVDAGAPPGLVLQGVKLTARDAIDRHRPDLPQELQLGPGVTGIRRPDGGLLVRFTSRGRDASGLLLVDAGGVTRAVLELPLAAGRTPWTPWIAVSAWEPVVAMLTSEDRTGRGDVYLVRVDGATFPATGRPWRKVTAGMNLPDPEPHSLTFAAGSLYFVDDDRVLMRAPSDGSGDAIAVPLPASGGVAPAELSEEIQVSEDGSTLALLAGEDEKIWDVYVGDAQGSFRNITDAPDEYQPVGHLTSDRLGPGLALSRDGREIVYGCECPELELFHRHTTAGATPTHISGDPQFAESMDDGSGIAITAAGIVLGFGEARDAKDLFRLLVRAGQVIEATNLTRSSGDASAPFQTGGGITPRAIHRDVEGRFLLVDDRSQEFGRPSFDLWTVAGDRVEAPLIDLRAEPDLVPAPAESTVSACLLFEDGRGHGIAMQTRALASPLRVLLQAPAGVSLRGLSVSPSGASAAVIASAGPGRELPVVLDLKTRNARLPQARAGHMGPRTTWTADDRALWTWGTTPDRVVQIAVHPGTPARTLDLGSGQPVLLR